MRIGLDIDGVLGDFSGHFLRYLKLPEHPPTEWDDPRIRQNFYKIENDEAFWMSIPPITNPMNWDKKPSVYITARTLDPVITSKWLHKHCFPDVPLITTYGNSKLEHVNENCDIYLDDSAAIFEEISTKSSAICFLKDRTHNHHVNTKFRIYDADELLIQ